MRHGSLLCSMLLFGLWLTAPASGQMYDAALDFSTSGNPNGVWTYGFSDTLTSSFLQDTDFSTGTQIDMWSGDRAPGGYPLLWHNKTALNLSFANTVRFQPGQMIMHPGPAGEYSALRFTAPTSGNFSLAALFSGQDVVGTTTDVHIFGNGTELFAGSINGYLNTASFSKTLTLTANDIVSVKVGTGGNGYGFDSTGVSFRVTVLPSAVPESSAFTLLIGTGMTGAGVLVRRKQKLVER